MDEEEQKLKKHHKGYRIYRVCRWLVHVFYPKTEVIGTENLPDEPCIAVGNHSQANGPIVSQLYYPGKAKAWCVGQMQNRKEVPAYAYQDFWSGKPKYIRWFFKIASYVIAPLCEAIFTNADVIPVYRDNRLLSTFRETVADLQDGYSIVIFPEHYIDYNHILCDFEENFVDTARFYYRKTGKALNFVPMYLAPRLKKVYIGKPILFDPKAPIQDERKRICDYLKTEITEIACSLPEHVVVPYRNISKKLYGTNIQPEK